MGHCSEVEWLLQDEILLEKPLQDEIQPQQTCQSYLLLLLEEDDLEQEVLHDLFHGLGLGIVQLVGMHCLHFLEHGNLHFDDLVESPRGLCEELLCFGVLDEQLPDY